MLSHKKKNKTMPLAATWMYLEMIILREIIRERKTVTIWHHLYVERKTQMNMSTKQKT